MALPVVHPWPPSTSSSPTRTLCGENSSLSPQVTIHSHHPSPQPPSPTHLPHHNRPNHSPQHSPPQAPLYAQTLPKQNAHAIVTPTATSPCWPRKDMPPPICGIERKLFWYVLAAGLFVMVAAIAIGVGAGIVFGR